MCSEISDRPARFPITRYVIPSVGVLFLVEKISTNARSIKAKSHNRAEDRCRHGHVGITVDSYLWQCGPISVYSRCCAILTIIILNYQIVTCYDCEIMDYGPACQYGMNIIIVIYVYLILLLNRLTFS